MTTRILMSKCFLFNSFQIGIDQLFLNFINEHRQSKTTKNQLRATVGGPNGLNPFDDNFERVVSENGAGGVNLSSSNGFINNSLNLGSAGGSQVKQKEFIIKKMFKVPSNE